MPDVMHLYLDDSGTRHPNKNPAMPAPQGRDWFSLGGVLIRQADEGQARDAHAQFMRRWELDPDIDFLHSTEIRGRSGNFTWLAGRSPEEHGRFLEDLYQLMATMPVIGFACVIDRAGYNSRYRQRYGNQPWSLCRTAFSVVVERAAKFARSQRCKLKVFVERSDRNSDGWIRGYYDHMRRNGMPFDPGNMGKYGPLTQEQFAETLYDLKFKEKSSPLMQMADLYLWPMSIGGYHRSSFTYARLVRDRKLIDCQLAPEDVPVLGIKYSCWEGVEIRP